MDQEGDSRSVDLRKLKANAEREEGQIRQTGPRSVNDHKKHLLKLKMKRESYAGVGSQPIVPANLESGEAASFNDFERELPRDHL